MSESGYYRIEFRGAHWDMSVNLTAASEDEAVREAIAALRADSPTARDLGDQLVPTHVEWLGPPYVPARVERLPDGLEVRTHTLDDGRLLRATVDSPFGDTTVQMGDEPGFPDRSPGLALSFALGITDDDDPTFVTAAQELFGRRTSDGWRFPCPACDAFTLDELPPGTYGICTECGWEDDPVAFDDPDYRGGANGDSLREWRARWGPDRTTKAGKRRKR